MNVEALTRHFTPDQIKQRKGPFSQKLNDYIQLDFVEAHTVIARLNEAFEFNWDFRVVSHEVTEAEVLVLGELVADGVVKQQFGGKEREDKIPLGFTAKIAASDALKKCATLFGVALHLYEDKPPRAPVGDGGGGQAQKDSGSGGISPKQATMILGIVKSDLFGPEEKEAAQVFVDSNPAMKAASDYIRKLQAARDEKS